MDKNAIKKFATEARRELMARVSQRALLYGISPEAKANPEDDVVEGRLLSSTEKRQRAALIEAIKEKSYDQVMEEVAYTWFNRFCALRFMEVNGYLPGRVRVFTDENNAFKPQILAEAIHLEMEGLDREKVFAYKEADANDDLYKYLLITQCNALSGVLPKMFQKIADATELLFPDNLLREGSVLHQMIETIPEDDWKDAVQIIGWLYQYYNSEKKDEVFARKKDEKIRKENIPAATQLFTPDWIVRYMVENSLGRLWVEGHPNDVLKSNWKYYLEEAEQEPEVQAQLAILREEYKALKPEDILCIDPCSGSGHILAYMFDVLVQIYEAYGVDTRSAVASIVENNIYGLDIDDRAAQLSYFTVMMKACQYDKRFLRRKVQPHVYAIVESNHVDRHVVDYFCNGDAKLKEAMDTIIEELHDAKEYGSIIAVSQQDWDALYARFDEIQNESVMSIYTDAALRLRTVVEVAEALSNKYHSVITNPPYMAISSCSSKLNKFINDNFVGGKTDLFSVFIEKCIELTMPNCFTAMITMQSWMFLASFKKIRERILDYELCSMAHLGARGFDEISGEVVQTTAFSIRKTRMNGNYIADFSRLIDGTSEKEKETLFLSKSRLYHRQMRIFHKVPQSLFAYWVNESTISCFDDKALSEVFVTREGMATAGNDTFLRQWFEVNIGRINFDIVDNEDAIKKNVKWVPYNKGGSTRDWYGNNDYVVDWENNGFGIRNNRDPKTGRIRSHNYNGEYGFKEGLTWSAISSGDLSVRYTPKGFLFDSKGAKGFVQNGVNKYWVLGLLNSKVAMQFLQFISPTLDFKVGDVITIPYKSNEKYANTIVNVSRSLVQAVKVDWDSFETSWDFKHHPLAREVSTIAEAFDQWKTECESRFTQLKANEEELNRIFIDIYGLQDELTPEVADKDITVYRVFDAKEDVPESMAGSRYVRTKEDEVVSFISYAVGCMFGRYSLDVDGLAYAGGDWDASKYATFAADKDNIIPICDDEYFDDDIVGRFVKFVEVVYGKDTLEENLKFIADALGGKGQPKEVIRKYFLKGFYADHCSRYSVKGSGERPIYWMFDSGKKNGFKCLIYMHRYESDTLARIRTDYVHEQQARYRTAIADLENRMANASTSVRVKLNKQLKTLNDQAKEIHEYEEKIHHLADQMISIDLDDGVKVNYAKFQDVLAKIK